MHKKIFLSLQGFERYLLVTLLGVAVIYFVNILGVDLLGFSAPLVYFFSTLINFTIAYFLYLKIFQSQANRANLAKYLINLLVFFVIMNILFNIFVAYYHLHYLLAISLNFVIFPLLKFFSYKYLVFNKET